MEDILLGTTDRSILVFVSDPASTDGSGKTGLTHSDLTVSYTRVETDNDVVVTDVTSSLSTLSALTDAHTDWGVKEVSSSLAPGLYRLDVADAVFASGAWYSVVYVMITTSAAAASPKAFKLVAYNPLDSVRLGLTALPNAAAEASGGLYTRGTGAGQINQDANGRINVNVAAISGDTTAADNEEAFFDGTGYAGTNNVIPTVTTLTNAPSDSSGVTTLLSRIGGSITITSGRVNADVTHIATSAVSTSSAQLGVNVVNAAGTAWNSGAITANTLAADTITAAKLASDVTTELQSGLATASALATVDGIVDTIVLTTDKLDDLIEDSSGYRFTEKSLEQAPSGGGGGSGDWTADEKTAIRSILGIPSSGTTPADPTTGILDTIRDKIDAVDDFVDTEVAAIKAKTDNLPSDPADASDIATAFSTVNSKLDTIDDFLDTEIAAIKAKTDNLPSDPADASDIASSFSTVNTKLDTIDDLLDTEVAAIKAKTDNLPSDPADASDIASSFSTVNSKLDAIDAYIDTEVAAIKAKTDLIPASPAAVGSAMTLADGAITEAKISTPAEAAGRPTGILAMIRRVFEWQSNKRVRTRSTGALVLRNDADNGTLETQTQSTTGSSGSEVDTQTEGV